MVSARQHGKHLPFARQHSMKRQAQKRSQVIKHTWSDVSSSSTSTSSPKFSSIYDQMYHLPAHQQAPLSQQRKKLSTFYWTSFAVSPTSDDGTLLDYTQQMVSSTNRVASDLLSSKHSMIYGHLSALSPYSGTWHVHLKTLLKEYVLFMFSNEGGAKTEWIAAADFGGVIWMLYSPDLSWWIWSAF